MSLISDFLMVLSLDEWYNAGAVPQVSGCVWGDGTKGTCTASYRSGAGGRFDPDGVLSVMVNAAALRLSGPREMIMSACFYKHLRSFSFNWDSRWLSDGLGCQTAI